MIYSDIQNLSVDELYNMLPEGEEGVFQLLNMDSVLALSYMEKNIYRLIYLGKSDKEICEELSVNPSTLRTYKANLRKQMCSAKIILLLVKKLGLSLSRSYTKKTIENHLSHILDEENRITGFAIKDDLHNVHNPQKHATVIVLAGQRGADGVVRYVTCSKSVQLLTGKSFLDKSGNDWIDILGGHVKMNDGGKIGEKLDEKIYDCAVQRELSEELHLKNFKDLKSGKLKLLYYDECNHINYPTGWNYEKSGVYMYRIPDSIKPSDIVTYDEWNDSIGETVKRRFPSCMMSWHDLVQLAEDKVQGKKALDGLKRVVSGINSEPELYKAMTEFFSCAE